MYSQKPLINEGKINKYHWIKKKTLKTLISNGPTNGTDNYEKVFLCNICFKYKTNKNIIVK